MVHLRFGSRNDAPELRSASVGMLARKTKRFRRREVGPEEEAERPSQRPTEAPPATAPFSSRNEHVRSRVSSTGRRRVLSRRGASAGSGGFPIMSELWFALCRLILCLV